MRLGSSVALARYQKVEWGCSGISAVKVLRVAPAVLVTKMVSGRSVRQPAARLLGLSNQRKTWKWSLWWSGRQPACCPSG